MQIFGLILIIKFFNFEVIKKIILTKRGSCPFFAKTGVSYSPSGHEPLYPTRGKNVHLSMSPKLVGTFPHIVEKWGITMAPFFEIDIIKKSYPIN